MRGGGEKEEDTVTRVQKKFSNVGSFSRQFLRLLFIMGICVSHHSSASAMARN